MPSRRSREPVSQVCHHLGCFSARAYELTWSNALRNFQAQSNERLRQREEEEAREAVQRAQRWRCGDEREAEIGHRDREHQEESLPPPPPPSRPTTVRKRRAGQDDTHDTAVRRYVFHQPPARVDNASLRSRPVDRDGRGRSSSDSLAGGSGGGAVHAAHALHPSGPKSTTTPMKAVVSPPSYDDFWTTFAAASTLSFASASAAGLTRIPTPATAAPVYPSVASLGDAYEDAFGSTASSHALAREDSVSAILLAAASAAADSSSSSSRSTSTHHRPNLMSSSAHAPRGATDDMHIGTDMISLPAALPSCTTTVAAATAAIHSPQSPMGATTTRHGPGHGHGQGKTTTSTTALALGATASFSSLPPVPPLPFSDPDPDPVPNPDPDPPATSASSATSFAADVDVNANPNVNVNVFGIGLEDEDEEEDDDETMPISTTLALEPPPPSSSSSSRGLYQNRAPQSQSQSQSQARTEAEVEFEFEAAVGELFDQDEDDG